jgi:hypothetical protein
MSLTMTPPTPSVTSALAAAQPLPLPVGGWGGAEGLAALAEARAQLPVELPAATVVSALTTVVLRAGEYAVKVYPPDTDAARLDRLADVLAGSATAHVPLTPAVVTSYGVVTLTRWLPPARPVSWPELGTLLRAFHCEHAAAFVPRWTPLSRLASQVASLPEECAAVLLGARESLLAALADVSSEVGEGPIHGDVSRSNVMRTDSGPRLIDLDWVAWAPREYDLASAARRFRAGEISRWTYARFCSAYGFDVRSWPGLPVLDRIADLGGVAFRLWDSHHHGLDLDWVQDELRVWATPL